MKRHLRYSIHIAVGTVACALLLTCVACDKGTSRVLPDELVDFWTTDGNRYHGRFLELTKAYVILGEGKGSARVHAIRKVEAKPTGDTITYTIYSEDSEDGSDVLILEYSPVNGGQFQFASQRGVLWKRCRGELCGIEDMLERRSGATPEANPSKDIRE